MKLAGIFNSTLRTERAGVKPPTDEEARALRRIFLVLAIILIASVFAFIRFCGHGGFS